MTSATVKSDENLFAIIEELQEFDEVGVTELADHLQITKSSVHKHLKTLEQNEYVVNNSGTYRLSFKFLCHGGYVRQQNKLCQLARRKVNELVKKTDRLVTFAVKEHGRGVFVYLRNDRYGLRETIPLGERFYLHQNAAGKAMLAELSRGEIEEIIERHGLPKSTENTITDKEKLFEELTRFREQNYATGFEEQVEGAHAVSTAVRDIDMDMLGSISLYCPADSLTENKRRQEYADNLQDVANELQLQTRYKNPAE